MYEEILKGLITENPIQKKKDFGEKTFLSNSKLQAVKDEELEE